MSAPTRRMRLPCCARAASGQAVAVPPSSMMNSRRFMGLPKAKDHGLSIAGWNEFRAVHRSKIDH
jgi:hypothetical protein